MKVETIKYKPSITIYKKYKHYNTYKGKVIIISSSMIKSETCPIERTNQEDALEDAQQMIRDMENGIQNLFEGEI